jgi:hypothetical protein
MPVHGELPHLALSIRQPWATLVVLGLKSVEIRRWSTPIRGPVYIHAGKIADGRPEGWSRVPEEYWEITARRGGLIGTADLVDCITYASARDFGRDRQLHFNPLSWFLPPHMFGFRFAQSAIVPFRAISGQVKFFPVAPSPAARAHWEMPAELAPGPKTPKKLVTFEL